MPIRLFPGTSPGSAAPAAAIEQAGSPTVLASAMRWAAAVAADEVYQVVVVRTGASGPVVCGAVGPADVADGFGTCCEGAGRVAGGVRVGAGRADDAGGCGAADLGGVGFGERPGAVGLCGSPGAVGCCACPGVAGFGGCSGVADFRGWSGAPDFRGCSGAPDRGGGFGFVDWDGGSGAVGRGVVSGAGGRGVRRGAEDRADAGGDAGAAPGVRRADAPGAVPCGTGGPPGDSCPAVGRRPGGAGSVAGLPVGGGGTAVGRCPGGVGPVVGRPPGGVGRRGRDVGPGERTDEVDLDVGVRRSVLDGSVVNVQDGSGFSVGRDRSFEAEGRGLGVPSSCATHAHTPTPPRTSTAAPPTIHGARLGGRR